MYVHLTVLPAPEGVAAADLGRSQPWSPEQSGSRNPLLATRATVSRSVAPSKGLAASPWMFAHEIIWKGEAR